MDDRLAKAAPKIKKMGKPIEILLGMKSQADKKLIHQLKKNLQDTEAEI